MAKNTDTYLFLKEYIIHTLLLHTVQYLAVEVWLTKSCFFFSPFFKTLLFRLPLCSFLSPHFLTKEGGSQELTCVLTNVLDALCGFEWFSVQEKETHSSQHIVTLVHSSQTTLTHSA